MWLGNFNSFNPQNRFTRPPQFGGIGQQTNRLPQPGRPIFGSPVFDGPSFSRPAPPPFMLASLVSLMQDILRNLTQLLQPPAQNPPAQNPPVSQPPVQNPPVNQPPVPNPPQNPPVQQPPVQQPPVQQPPVQPPQNPPVSGSFPPGTLPLNQVPVDAQGNITQDFLRSMLTPGSTVNTNLFDNNHPSGLSSFARIGIRMMGHDLYDGQLDGDVILRTLLAPDQSGNRAFTVSPAVLDMAKQWGKMDLEDDGVINGSVYGKLIQDVWPVTDDASIPGFANNLKFKAASLNAAEMFRPVQEPTTAAGMAEFTQRSGLTANQLLAFSLWGHKIMDRNVTMQEIAQGALTNPNAIDFKMANLTDGTKAFTQNLVNDPNARHTVGLDVLNTLLRHLR